MKAAEEPAADKKPHATVQLSEIKGNLRLLQNWWSKKAVDKLSSSNMIVLIM